MASVLCHAMRLLPQHMALSTFTALESLPLTANGKLTVIKLPAPKFSSSMDKACRQPALEVSQDPTNDTLPEKLRCIWSDAFSHNTPNFLEQQFNVRRLDPTRVTDVTNAKEGLKAVFCIDLGPI